MSNYGLTREEILDVLHATADNVDAQNPSHAGQLGAGRINADRASVDSTFVGNTLFLPAIGR